MKRNKKILTVITILLLIVCMAVPVSAAGKINKKKATLKVGQTLQLKVTGTKGKVKWKSSKKSVATVSSKGRVKAKKKGSATITAKVGKKKYTCKVTVKKPATNSNGGFSGNTNANTNANTSGKKNVVTYHAESTPYGAVAILENHYDHTVDLTVEFVYYLNGSMIGTSKGYNYAFAPHSKCALQGWNHDKTWDSFKINLKIEKASNVITNNSGIRYSSNFGDNNVMVEVKNVGRKNYSTQIGVVFYQNGRIVGYNYNYAHVENPGSTAYLQFNFPYDRNYDDIIPDRYEVYVNNSYTYSWMN
nr:MAG TPA: intimin [Caudoviricetes sp.]